jgi:hypothetical protein
MLFRAAQSARQESAKFAGAFERCGRASCPRRKLNMQVYVALQPLVALIAGILILMIPRLLNYIVAIYLIVTGILGLVRM